MEQEVKIQKEKQRFKPWIIYIFFGIIYCTISLVNHYTFKTFAWDLGITNNAIFDYSHFRINQNTLLPGEQFKNILSDHLSLYPIFVSPFIFIFGSYTMLIFQIVAILFGGFGVYRFVFYTTHSMKLANLSLVFFFSLWGIYSALSFDYHDNVVAAMFLPWLFYYFYKNNFKAFFLLAIIVMIGKENMALWMIFVSLGLFIQFYNNMDKRKFALSLALLSGIYFYLAINSFIPAMSNAGRGFLHFNYSALGGNFAQAIVRVVTDPIYTIKLLWVNNSNNTDAIGIKAELHKVFFLSGGLLLFLRPSYFIMLIPIYAQKLFNDDFLKWGINYHYSIEFAPILAIGVFDAINKRIRADKAKEIAVYCTICLAVFTTASTMDRRISKYYSKENVAFYKLAHYTNDFDIREVYQAIKLIPDESSLSASEVLVPHLAFRDTIYQFPVIKNAKFLAIIIHKNSYPLNDVELQKFCKRLDVNPKWLLIYNKNAMRLYKRKEG